MDNSPTTSRRFLLAALLTILLVAGGLRLYRLPERPLGLHYDEAANGILAGEIAHGVKRPIFIASYTGKEVLFFYWTALWMKLLGVTPLALRLGAASIGVATVAVTVWAIYELLHDHSDAPWIALAAAACLAVSFWHLVLSRYGFRAVTQPLLQALTVAALWRGLRPRAPSTAAVAQKEAIGGIPWLILAGLFCGLTAYTYLAARAFPLPLATALVTLVIADRHRRRERLAQSAIFVGTAALVLAPLAHYWLTHPGSFSTRAKQVAAQNWAEVQRGLLACLKMFFLQGDPYIRFNLPGRPLFGPVVAALFILGLGAGIWHLVRLLRASEEAHRPLALASSVFLFVSIPMMLLPSALATNEITPSNLRTVGLLPFIYVFPALGLWALVVPLRGHEEHEDEGREVGRGRYLTKKTPLTCFLLPAACLLLLGISGASAARDYLGWASSPALYYAADGDLADIAGYLNDADLSATTPYVASQHYRHPTLAFLAEDYDAVRWLVGGRTLVFPPEGNALFLFPRSASDDLDWVRSLLPEDALVEAPLGPDGAPAFHVYRGNIRDANTKAANTKDTKGTEAGQRTVSFGQVALLLGYTVTNQPRSGASGDIAIWWRVTGAADQPDYRVVARVADRWGSLWGERQAFHYPSEQWRCGELIVDHVSIPIAPGAPPGDYAVRFGLYAPGTEAHLPVVDDKGAYAGLYAELPVQVARAATPAPVEDMSIDNRLDAAVDGLTLLGTQLDTTTARPGEPLYITLFWRAGETILPPHELSLQLGETTLYQGAPVHDTYPFSEWKPGEVVADRYDPRLPLDTPPGRHRLRLQVGDRETFELAEINVQATDRTFEVPPTAHPLTVTLGHRLELLGYDLSTDSVAPGETLTLTLTWRALTEMETDYTVFTHLLAADGSMAGQQDRQPIWGSYPTSLWARGEVVTDVYTIPVSPTAAPGEHQLEVGMYVAETGMRLSIEGDADNAITLQTISVTNTKGTR
jgi:hypothetical protein